MGPTTATSPHVEAEGEARAVTRDGRARRRRVAPLHRDGVAEEVRLDLVGLGRHRLEQHGARFDGVEVRRLTSRGRAPCPFLGCWGPEPSSCRVFFFVCGLWGLCDLWALWGLLRLH